MYKKDSYQLTAKILPNIMMLKVLKEEKFLNNIIFFCLNTLIFLLLLYFYYQASKSIKHPENFVLDYPETVTTCCATE